MTPTSSTLGRHRLKGLVLGLLLAIAASLAAFDTEPHPDETVLRRRDWPMFGGGPSRNLATKFESGLPASFDIETGKNIKWVAKLGSSVYGAPVVADGKLFIGTNNRYPKNPKVTDDHGVMMCFRESDGQFLWQALHDKLANDELDASHVGIVSMPAVVGDRLYYVSNRGELVCADTAGFLDNENDGLRDEQYTSPIDADFVWRLDMVQTLGVHPHYHSICSPLVVDDLVYVCTNNGPTTGLDKILAPEAPSFLAVNRWTGKVVWEDNSPTAKLAALKKKGPVLAATIHKLRSTGQLVLEGQWSSPAYAEVDGRGQVYFGGGDGWLRAFEPKTGKLLWKFDCNPRKAIYKANCRSERSGIFAAPVVWGNYLYVSTGQNPDNGVGEGHLWCIDLEKATRFGRANQDGNVSPVNDNFDPKAPVNKKSALVWHYGGKMPGAGAARTDRDFHFGRTISTCAVFDGLVYAAELYGYLHCLDARTGKVYWVDDLRDSTWSSPFYADGKVYMPNDAGEVFIYAHAKRKRLVGFVEDVWDSPRGMMVAANGVLYLAVNRRLYAIGRQSTFSHPRRRTP